MELDVEKQPIWIVFNLMCPNWIVVVISRDWGIGRGRLDRGRMVGKLNTVWFVMATESPKKLPC